MSKLSGFNRYEVFRKPKPKKLASVYDGLSMLRNTSIQRSEWQRALPVLLAGGCIASRDKLLTDYDLCDHLGLVVCRLSLAVCQAWKRKGLLVASGSQSTYRLTLATGEAKE